MLLTATSPNISSASLAHSPHCTGDHVLWKNVRMATLERDPRQV